MRVLLANCRREQRALRLYVKRRYSDLCGLESFLSGLSLGHVRMLFSRQHLNDSHSNLVIKQYLNCGVMWLPVIMGEY
jgi:hypothetical protein